MIPHLLICQGLAAPSHACPAHVLLWEHVNACEPQAQQQTSGTTGGSRAFQQEAFKQQALEHIINKGAMPWGYQNTTWKFISFWPYGFRSFPGAHLSGFLQTMSSGFLGRKRRKGDELAIPKAWGNYSSSCLDISFVRNRWDSAHPTRMISPRTLQTTISPPKPYTNTKYVISACRPIFYHFVMISR